MQKQIHNSPLCKIFKLHKYVRPLTTCNRREKGMLEGMDFHFLELKLESTMI